MSSIYRKISSKKVMIIVIWTTLIIVSIISIKMEKDEKNYNQYEQLYDEEYLSFDEKIIRLKKEKKYSEQYTLEGMKEYNKGNMLLANKKFEQAIEKENKKTYYRTKFLANKYLFEINKRQGQYEKARFYLIEGIKSIPKRYYNKNHTDIGDLIKLTYDVESLRDLIIKVVEDLLLEKKYINDKTELYLRERMRSIYILSNKYAEVTDSLIEAINLSQEVNDAYSLADSKISLGLVFAQLGGENTAQCIIEDALKIKIEDEYLDAEVKTYGYLNLAYLQYYYFGETDKAINTLSKIEKYRDLYEKEDFRDIEIYKLIYEANCFILDKKLDLAKGYLDKIQKLINEDKNESYANKRLEYYLTYARYFNEKDMYNDSLECYKYVLQEYEKIDDRHMQELILNEVISLKSIKGDEVYNEYVEKILRLGKDMTDLRYHDYSVYIANSIEEKNQHQYDYKQNIRTLRILYISVISILLFYIYTNNKMKKLKHLGYHDGLTNVYNRKKFDIDINKLLGKNHNFACIIMDIDDFKKINDGYGHGVGDIVLINTCKKIKNILPEEYRMYRYGGEEFIILAQYEQKDDVISISKDIRKSVEEMIWKEKITVTISMGVAFSHSKGENVLEIADENLYKAKNSGKNKVVY